MFRRLVQSVLLALAMLHFAGCDRKRQDSPPTNDVSREFLALMNAGKNFMDRGEATNALAVYLKARALVPADSDVHLNLANAHLMAGDAAEANRAADEVLKLDPDSAAAWFVKGCAALRLSNWEDAVKALENTKRIQPGEPAVFFQLGMARMGLRQWDVAAADFREGLRLDPNRIHAPVRYQLGQALIRAGRQAEANQELQLHQLRPEDGPASAATFERSRFTQPRVPFRLDQPAREGIRVRFVDATDAVFGEQGRRLSGPLAIINANHKGWMHLFAYERGQGFRVLWNSNGVFRPDERLHPSRPGAKYARMLVGDLQNDRFDDVLVLGEAGSHLFQFGTNRAVIDVSAQAGVSGLAASDGLLMDLDFTGKLDLVAATASNGNVRILRQFGPLRFSDITSTSGVPATLERARVVTMDDWDRDGDMDVVVSRSEGAPLLLEKLRGGPLVPREQSNWVAGAAIAAGDFDNDLRPDLAVAGPGGITVCFSSGQRAVIPSAGRTPPRQLVAVDHDNDGWLDLWAVGDGIRAWRNTGLAGFQDQTKALGLDGLKDRVSEIQFADFDVDCDADAIVALAGGGIRYLRNVGGNAHAQVKVQMIGNRSNASGIGCRVEIATGGLRLTRTVHRLPVEIGVGRAAQLDSFLVHWFNWPQGSAELGFSCRDPIFSLELTIQEGSCPYLYAWDGKGFRFVTDILGSAPIGLPVAEGRHVDSDPEEFVWIGDERTFPPRDGAYEVRITEELREVLYLDEAQLVVVDREPGTEVHTTDKLRPGRPFPPGELVTLHRERRLRKATHLDGRDVTAALERVDGMRASPPRLREPQLRGLAEPHGFVLDFGPLETELPLVLVMNGWLRFGGGMANIAASHDPSLPFPFPILEAEVEPGTWKAVDVTVGAPSGKTKTILVDLEGRLPPGTRRLRLSGAFEIHWDRIALMEKKHEARTTITRVRPDAAELRYRGFSALRDLSADWPLTPDYDRVTTNFFWTIAPGGWCTRYGDVRELVAARDEGLALINAGDELALRFNVVTLPPKPANTVREFFLYVDGWDKDSDFHVARGTEVEPLPFHGMDDQNYGRQPRPAFPSDALHRKYNTRWVEGRVLKQTAAR